MTTFKKYTGNYIQVINALELPKRFYMSTTKDDYEKQITKDLGRTRYVSHRLTVMEIKKRLQDTSHLYNDVTHQLIAAGKYLSFTQGDFEATNFTNGYMMNKNQYMDGLSQAGMENTQTDYHQVFRIIYVNDNDELCGLSIMFMRDDSDTKIAPELRKRPFVVVVTKNTTATPSEREVTYLSHPALIYTPEVLERGKDLEEKELANEITKTINSKTITQLLTGLIAGDSVSINHFNQLDDRIKGNRNIDDRDTKLNKLSDLYVIWARLRAENSSDITKQQHMNKIMDIMQSATQKLSYFQDKDWKWVENIVKAYECLLVSNLPAIKEPQTVKEKLMSAQQQFNNDKTATESKLAEGLAAIHDPDLDKELSHSVIRRNISNFTIFGIALLAVIGIALTLSGVLAPLGLTITAGLASYVAVAGAAACVVALDRGFAMTDHERELKTYQQTLARLTTTLQSQYCATMASIKDTSDREMSAVSKSLEYKKTVETKDARSARPQRSMSWSSSGNSCHAFFARHHAQDDAEIPGAKEVKTHTDNTLAKS